MFQKNIVIEPRTDFVNDRDTIIRCRTADGAYALMHALAKRFPRDKDITDIKKKIFHSDATEEGLCYRIRSKNGRLYIDHCFESYYASQGRDIIDLSELCRTPDYGDIELGYLDKMEALASLF